MNAIVILDKKPALAIGKKQKHTNEDKKKS